MLICCDVGHCVVGIDASTCPSGQVYRKRVFTKEIFSLNAGSGKVLRQ